MIWGKKAVLARDLAVRCALPYAESVKRLNGDGTESVYTIQFGYRKVRLPGRDRDLWLLVVDGFGSERLMALTTQALRKDRKTLWWAVEAYLTRWRIEETIRFSKQAYGLEDVRVLQYESLKYMVALALVAAYFSMAYLGARAKVSVLCHHAIRAGNRLFGLPDFRYYTIADGIHEIFSRSHARPFAKAPPGPTQTAQLKLLLYHFKWNPTVA